jgi:hypothetical protein
MAGLRDKTNVFIVNHVLESGERLHGQFTSKKMSIMDRSRIGVRRSQLAGGMYCVRDDDGKATGQGIDSTTDWLNWMIATMEICLVQKPTWFNLAELDDLELLEKVFTEVMTFESSFRGPQDGSTALGEGHRTGSENTRGAQPEGEVASGSAPKVVVQKVQASLDA